MTRLWGTVACATIVLGLAGCQEGTAPSMKEAGDAVKETAKETGDAVKGAAESTSEAVGEAAESAGEAAKEAGAKLSEGFAAATDKAATALKGIDGGGELLTKVKDFFSSAQETLKGITNKESAEGAAEKLGDLEGTLEKIGETTAEMPEEARMAIAAMIEQGTAHLKALMEKLSERPEVREVIKPKWDALMEKLKSMSGK